MAREIRSTPLRYGLALGSFGLAILVVLGLPRDYLDKDRPHYSDHFRDDKQRWQKLSLAWENAPITTDSNNCRLPIAD